MRQSVQGDTEPVGPAASDPAGVWLEPIFAEGAAEKAAPPAGIPHDSAPADAPEGPAAVEPSVAVERPVAGATAPDRAAMVPIAKARAAQALPTPQVALKSTVAPKPAAPKQPPPRRRRPLVQRDPLWARLMVWAGALVIFLSGGTIVATWAAARQVDNSINRDRLLAPDARGGQGLVGPLNFLLLGSDARKDNPGDGERSDTIIIVHIPKSMDRAYLISVPRDLRVEIPSFSETEFGGGTDKVNSAFQHGKGGSGGVRLLSATLTDLMAVQFDGAAVIDFDGFKKAVQLLGGVHMCVDQRTESQHIGYDKDGKFLAPWEGPEGTIRVPESTPFVHEVGCRHLTDWEALDYVRQRKSLPNGDIDRQRHQQQFLKAILDEARRQGVATNPTKLTALVRAIGSSLTVDTNGVRIADLVVGLSDVKPDSVVGVKLPATPQDIGGVSYMLQDEKRTEPLYRALRDDSLDSWAAANPEWVNPL